MDAARVGAAIKTLRTNAGYTQHQLADVMGVTDKAVSKWERGLSVPDVSIVTKLSILLNVDVDNLLEGNITYIEKTWQGLLILKEGEICSGSKAFGKPLVYFYLSYFMLAGIREIYIVAPDKDRKFVDETIDGGRYGIHLHLIHPGSSLIEELAPGNTMVVFNNPFVYGPNLTKYFQRAMSRPNGISVLTVSRVAEEGELSVSFDNHKAIQITPEEGITQVCAPILFVPKRYFDQVSKAEGIEGLEPLYAEPMGNGMLEYSIRDEDSLLDTAFFLRYMKKTMGKDIYNLDDVAKNRNFIKEAEASQVN